MIRMSREEREQCAQQAKIFEASVAASNDSSAVFVRRFMRSDLAKRMDSKAYVAEATQPEAAVREVDAAYDSEGYGSEKYSRNEMHWMGYFYRCFCCMTGKSSKEAFRYIGARELRGLYYPYHSLETEHAVERVLEARGKGSSSQIEQGVRALKAIRGIA